MYVIALFLWSFEIVFFRTIGRRKKWDRRVWWKRVSFRARPSLFVPASTASGSP